MERYKFRSLSELWTQHNCESPIEAYDKLLVRPQLSRQIIFNLDFFPVRSFLSFGPLKISFDLRYKALKKRPNYLDQGGIISSAPSGREKKVKKDLQGKKSKKKIFCRAN